MTQHSKGKVDKYDYILYTKEYIDKLQTRRYLQQK